jgi:thiol:disulfide interchange protein DsbD
LKLLAFLIGLLLISFINASPAFATESSSSVSKNSLFISEDQVLTPDQAFKLTISPQDKSTVQASFTIAPGHYLYRDRIKFESKNATIDRIDLPKGEIKKDPNFGEMEVFHQSFVAKIVLKNIPNNLQKVTLQASFQGCSEKGLCYSPIHKTIEVALSSNTVNPGITKSNDDQATTLLKGGKLWLIIIGFFSFCISKQLFEASNA